MLHVTYQNHMKQNLPYPKSPPFTKEHLRSPPAPKNLNIFYKSESPCNFISTTAKTLPGKQDKQLNICIQHNKIQYHHLDNYQENKHSL